MGDSIPKQSEASKERLRTTMRLAGRTIGWHDALFMVDRGKGTFVEEYTSLKGPYRLWFTPENVAEASPFPCCFEDLPRFEDSYERFFEWCQARFTTLEGGIAKLVGTQDAPYESLRTALDRARKSQRCVSIASPPKNIGPQ